MLIVIEIIKNGIWVNNDKPLMMPGNANPGEKITDGKNQYLVIAKIK